MRTSFIIVLAPLASAATLLLLPRTVHAAAAAEPVPQAERPPYRQGLQAEAGLGSGFSSTYGLGIAGDVGYTWSPGIIAGGGVQYFQGQTVNGESSHATFVGGEAGYRLFPTRKVEMRPYAFVGPAFITTVSPTANPNQPNVVSKTDVAVQPGVRAQYHFSDAFFVGGDAHYMLTPSPNTVAVMADAGLAF